MYILKNRVTMLIFLMMISLFILSACGGKEDVASSNTGETNTEDVSSEVESENSSNEQSNNGETVSYETQSIQLALVEPDGHVVTEGAKVFKEIVERESNGQISVEIFPNQQLGSMREQTEMTQMGSIQMSVAPVSTVGSFIEELQILELPFLFPNEEVMWQVLEGEVGNSILETANGTGLKGIGFWGGGFKQMTSNISPINSPEDLKGLDIRVIPSDALIQQYKTWGANPTPIDFAELYTSLQQGVVDAQENPLTTILSKKFYEVQDYLTITNHAYQFHFFMANENWFNNLNPETQKLLHDAELEARHFAINMNQEQNEQFLQELVDSGIEVNELDDAAIKEFQRVTLPLYETAADTDKKKELFNSLQDAVDSLQ